MEKAKIITKKATLSVCMIVKNEEKFLPDCLMSIQDIADELIIIDTGSVDNTVDIANEYGAKVHHFEWCDDFSVARNESIKYASSDWILWIDADERLDRTTVNQLVECIQPVKRPIVYNVKIRSYENNAEYERYSHSQRLFSNGSSISFDGRIHEQITKSASRVNALEKKAEFILNHLGYDAEVIDFDKKLKRNQPLLEKLVQETPNSYYSHFTLAQNYSRCNGYTEALKHFHIALSLGKMKKEMLAYIYNCISEVYLKTSDYSKAFKYAELSKKLFPKQCSAWYLLYKISKALDEKSNCIKHLKSLYSNMIGSENYPAPIVDTVPNRISVLDTLIKELVAAGENKDAVEYLKEGALTTGNIKYPQAILELLPGKENLKTLGDLLNELLLLGFDTFENQNLYGVVKIKLGLYEEALDIYWGIYRKTPEQQDVLKRISGLYAKLGDMNKAQEIMTIYQNGVPNHV